MGYTKNSHNLALILVSIICAGASLYMGLQDRVDVDDVYHLNAIWQVSQGNIPYRDFMVGHPPGMWIIFSPVAMLASCPSQYFLIGRLLTALFFGLSVYLVGDLFSARGGQAVLFGGLSLAVLLRSEYFIYRAEYVASCLVFLHYFYLTRIGGNKGVNRYASFIAALAISIACAMSFRPLLFLIIQPLFIFILRNNIRRQLTLWIGGILAGISPVVVYLISHQLWEEAAYWTFFLPASKEFEEKVASISWSFNISFEYIVIAILGLVLLFIIWRRKNLTFSQKILFMIVWPLTLIYYFLDPFTNLYYSKIYFYFLAIAVVSIIAQYIMEKVSMILNVRCRVIYIIAFSLLFFFFISIRLIYRKPIIPPFSRDFQRTELEIMDWMTKIASDNQVICVGPLHPIMVDDALDIPDANLYLNFIEVNDIKKRLRDSVDRAFSSLPTLICVDPWMEHNNGKNLLGWLLYKQILNPSQVKEIRDLLQSRYSTITFPNLSVHDFGSAFWVRNDCLNKSKIP